MNISASLLQALAPTGTLRAVINLGNPILASRDANGAPAGVSVDLATELARRLGVEAEFVVVSPTAHREAETAKAHRG